MGEEIIHGILLALHNIALVGCAAAPFYNRNLVLVRGQYGPKLSYELDKVVELINETDLKQIEISGHTDNEGPEEYNQKLSEGRAESVVNYLKQEGFKNSEIAEILGKDQRNIWTLGERARRKG